jgi:glycerate-2-kinase
MSARLHARRILDAALAAAEPRTAVQRALQVEENFERIWLIGAGKAACGMALGALDMLGTRISAGTVVTKDEHGVSVPGVEVREARHPLPDERGIIAAEEALRIAEQATERDLLLCLLSGGASALWPAPPSSVSLADLQATTDALLGAGAPIQELNAVRKHLSRIAGGQLARAAYPTRVVTLAISDVVGSPPDVIASGPTVPDPSTFGQALEILTRRGVAVPRSVHAYLQAGAVGERPETPKPGDPRFEQTSWSLAASIGHALRGAADEAIRLGYHTVIVTDQFEGEARDGGRILAGLAQGVRPPAALLFGGETTVTVHGDGRGGRNQELALAASISLEHQPGVLVAALGTDGTDGPTDAAGAIVDGATVARGRALGLDAYDHLRRNDAYPFLQATGDLLVTGPTGTNVADAILILVRPD